MSFYTYPAFGPGFGNEGPSDSAVSLTLSDIVDIPDEKLEQIQAPASGLHARSNAMSLGFILSEQTSSSPFYGIDNTITSLSSFHHSRSATGSSLEIEDTEEPRVHGWAPVNPDHYTLVENLGLPDVLLAATPGCLLSAGHEDAMVASGLPRTQDTYPPSTQGNLGSRLVHTQASAGYEKPIASPFPASYLPSAHSMHALAALASVRHILDSSAAPRLVTAPNPATAHRIVLSTQPSRAPRPAQPQRSTSGPSPRIPPAPRGGVAPALARSITNIRIARERALQAHTTRPQARKEMGSGAPGSGDNEPEPSVLGKWMAETGPL